MGIMNPTTAVGLHRKNKRITGEARVADWIINGIRGLGTPPDCVNQKSGELIVLGSAACIWEDYYKARKIFPGADLMTINLTACFWFQKLCDKAIYIHHWASLDPAFFELRDAYLLGETWTHCITKTPRVDHRWNVKADGSSGLFGVRVGLGLGYQKIILAGIPMTPMPHLYDFPETRLDWPDQSHVRDSWLWSVENEFQGRVKSCSGWSRELLGSVHDFEKVSA
jgi:hypothetical protein